MSFYFQLLSPEEVVPYPKAGPRKTAKGGRKPGRTRILTDTPEKEEVEERKKIKVKLTLINKESKNKREKKIQSKGQIGKRRKSEAMKSKALDESTSESESFEADDDSSGSSVSNPDFDYSAETVEEGDFLLIKFCTKTTLVHYVGRMEKEVDDEYEINFLRKKGTGFIFPTVPDITNIKKQDVVLKLPSPFKSGGSSRLFSILYFDIDLNNFTNLR